MNKQSKIKEYREKIVELNKRIQLCCYYKNRLNQFVSELKSRLENNQINFEEYYHYLNKGLRNKSLNEWLNIYDNYIKLYSEKIKEYNSRINRLSQKRSKLIYIAPIAIILILISSFILFKPTGITGYTVFGEVITSTDTLNLEINETSEYIWIPTKKGKLNSLMVSGEVIGEGYAKIYLVTETKDFLIFYKETGINKTTVLFSNDCIETCFLNLEQESYKLKFELQGSKVRLESITYFTVEVIDIDVYPKVEVINFKQGLYAKKSFKILNNKNKHFKAVVYIIGQLNHSITLHKSLIELYPNESFKEIDYDILLPDELEPGVYKTKIIVRYLPDKAFTGSTPTAELEIQVNSPYETGHIEPSLEIYRSEEDTIDFIIPVFNLGKKNIKKAKAIIQIYADANLIKKIETNEVSVNSYQKSELKASVKSLTPNNYKVIATVYYDGKEITLEKTINIDYSILVKDIQIRNLRDSAELNIILENKLNKKIHDINAEIILFDQFNTIATKLQTNYMNVNALEQNKLFAYIEYKNIKPGYYDGKITIKYQNKTLEKIIKLKIQENYTEIVMEKERIEISKIILITLFIILLLINLFWLIYFIKNKKIKKKMKN